MMHSNSIFNYFFLSVDEKNSFNRFPYMLCSAHTSRIIPLLYPAQTKFPKTPHYKYTDPKLAVLNSFSA